MRKQIVLILTTVTLILFASCTKDNNPDFSETPDLSETQFLPVSDSRITVGPEAATHVIKYEIVEPTGAAVTAETAQGTDWITKVNTTSAYGEVYFTVAVNSGSESRQTVLTLSYEGMNLDFTIVQNPYDAFTVTAQESECTSGKVVWKVVPPDAEITYVSMVVDKATWDSFASYEEYIAYDIEYFQAEAAERNLSYEEFLAKYVLKQGEGTYSANDLAADSDYVVYAYGMDGAGNILTGIYSAEARTLPVAQEDVTFELSVVQEFPYLTITADPSDDEVRYLMDTYGGTNTPEAITEAYQDNLNESLQLLAAMSGGSVYDFLMEVSYQGKAESEPFMIPEAYEFTVFAVAVDVYTGQLTSVASTLVCEMEL